MPQPQQRKRMSLLELLKLVPPTPPVVFLTRGLMVRRDRRQGTFKASSFNVARKPLVVF